MNTLNLIKLIFHDLKEILDVQKLWITFLSTFFPFLRRHREPSSWQFMIFSKLYLTIIIIKFEIYRAILYKTYNGLIGLPWIYKRPIMDWLVYFEFIKLFLKNIPPAFHCFHPCYLLHFTWRPFTINSVLQPILF